MKKLSKLLSILVINYEYPPLGGGGGLVTRDILEHIVALGHQVTIITSGYADLKRQENLNGVEVIRVPVLLRREEAVASLPSMLSYVPACIAKALFGLRNRKFDVINTHFAIPSGPAGHFLAKTLRIPNVLSIHGGDIFDPSKSLSPHKTPLLSSVVRAMLNKADRVVAQSEDTRQNAYHYYGIKRPVDIIPLGIKKPCFKKMPREHFHLSPSELVFCTIGRLVSRKNLDDALAVLAQLKEKYTFKFLIIGDGPERQHLDQKVYDLGLTDHVLFMGSVTDEEKFQLLSVADIYLSTALHEGFGLVYLEAMECALPVICFNRGGQTDFLVDGKTGYLVTLGDKETFKQRMMSLLDSPEKRVEMGAYNKELVKNYYIDICAEKYLSLFAETMEAFRAA